RGFGDAWARSRRARRQPALARRRAALRRLRALCNLGRRGACPAEQQLAAITRILALLGENRNVPPRRRWDNTWRFEVDYGRSGSSAAARGKITLISVNSPGSVSTSIAPPCCLTMMS